MPLAPALVAKLTSWGDGHVAIEGRRGFFSTPYPARDRSPARGDPHGPRPSSEGRLGSHMPSLLSRATPQRGQLGGWSPPCSSRLAVEIW